MKKTQTQNPLMVAYLIFLCICCVYYIISGIFDFEFPVWQRIVVAATIASYFFSVASMPKLTLRMGRKNVESLEKQNELYGKILVKEETLFSQEGKTTRAAEFISNQLGENIEEKAKVKKEMAQMEKNAFRLDVSGFLVFFCIMAFEGIYTFFAKSQEWYTLLAFVLVLFVEYLESTKASYYEELCQSSLDSLNEILMLLEERENG